MEMHKPKPWHGWRELAKEVVTIVIGVLIALGAEQAIEWLHWRREVASERRALFSEVRDNLDAVNSRIAIQGCVDRRLADLKLVFERHAHGQALGLIGHVGVPLAQGGSRGTWSIAISGQGLNHMSYGDQLGFSGAFANFENWDAIRREERAAWVRLGVLDDIEGLTEGDWALLRQAYAEARAASRRAADVGPFVLQTSSLGQTPSDAKPAEKQLRAFAKQVQDDDQQICRPLL